jgi:hypothetical protein
MHSGDNVAFNPTVICDNHKESNNIFQLKPKGLVEKAVTSILSAILFELMWSSTKGLIRLRWEVPKRCCHLGMGP